MFIIVITLAGMLLKDRIPPLFLLIVSLALIGSVVAFFEGQQWTATLWGIWLMFKYPMIGVHAYLYAFEADKFSRKLLKFCVLVLSLEVALQVGQYLAGAVPGDNLAGVFGRHGVGPLVMFLLFVGSLGFGQWLVRKDWKYLVWVIALSSISSILGEIKAFPIFILMLALSSLIVHLARGGHLRQAVWYFSLFIGAALFFLLLYNRLVADVRGTRRLEAYFNIATTQRYLANTSAENGLVYFGRGFALSYAWNAIQRDTTTLVAGFGLGARADSESLGIFGEGIRQSIYGRTVGGSSMLVLLQETGLGGLAVFGGFVVYFIFAVAQDIRRSARLDSNAVRYGMILFSLFWPVWLWYHGVWNFGAVMILYWTTVGYLLQRHSTGMSIKS